MKRRTFLQGTLASSMVGAAVGAGLLAPRMVLAAWPEAAFSAKGVDDAMNALIAELINDYKASLQAATDVLGDEEDEEAAQEIAQELPTRN